VAPPGPKPPGPPAALRAQSLRPLRPRSHQCGLETLSALHSRVPQHLLGQGGSVFRSKKNSILLLRPLTFFLSLKHRSPLPPGPKGPGPGPQPRGPSPPALTKTQSCRPFRARSVIGARALRGAWPKGKWPTRAWDVGVRGSTSKIARVPSPRIKEAFRSALRAIW